MKFVYFVRHGESEDNVRPVFQRDEAPLTERGRRQAGVLAARARALPIECVITSPSARAKETALEIVRMSPRPLEESSLFVERKKPARLSGRAYGDPEVRELDEAWKATQFSTLPPVEDGESFLLLKERAGKALRFLEEREEQRFLVVTHGIFLRMLFSVAAFGDVTPGEFEHLFHSLKHENTGITVFTHDPERPQPWGLWIWNDHAHLADA